jgi:hypothetical protein
VGLDKSEGAVKDKDLLQDILYMGGDELGLESRLDDLDFRQWACLPKSGETGHRLLNRSCRRQLA